MLVLLLFNPVVSSYENRAGSENEECCESIGRMFDSFMNSCTDESSVALNIMLPDSDTRLSFEGGTMTMTNSRGTWSYELRHSTETDRTEYGWEDYLVISKSGDVMTVRGV